MGQWENIYDDLGREGLIAFFQKTILNFFLREEDCYQCFNIEYTRGFKCTKCNKISDYEENNRCFDCSEKFLFKINKFKHTCL